MWSRASCQTVSAHLLTGTLRSVVLWDAMASCGTISVTNVNGADDTALAVWLETSLAQRFERTLHEPLPPALLEILEMEMETNVTLTKAQNQHQSSGFNIEVGMRSEGLFSISTSTT